MVNSNLGISLFGPEYDASEVRVVGVFEVKNKPVDISFENQHILPIGGYVIRYVSGSFMLMDQIPMKFVAGGPNGLQVAWKNAQYTNWQSIPFALKDNVDDPKELAKHSGDMTRMTYVEFTRPHQLQLRPPQIARGTVKVKILYYGITE